MGHQLRALGVISDPRLAFDCEAVDLLTEMYHDHGDTIALQYGGSHLVNTMETYRKLAQWSSHSRDLIENLKRYYSNSFIDAEKQVAIDLFLGIEPASPFPGIKEISAPHKSYRHWYTPEYLNAVREYEERDDHVLHVEPTDFWHAYYRPRLLTDMSRHFAFKVNSSLKYTSSGSVVSTSTCVCILMVREQSRESRKAQSILATTTSEPFKLTQPRFLGREQYADRRPTVAQQRQQIKTVSRD